MTAQPEAFFLPVAKSGLQGNGLATFSYFCFGNWYWLGASSWQTYLQGRDGQLRNTIMPTTKKFAAGGGKLKLLTGGPKLNRGVTPYEQVYSKSWKQPESYTTFIPGLMCSARLASVRGCMALRCSNRLPSLDCGQWQG